jgi:hypothetical protein
MEIKEIRLRLLEGLKMENWTAFSRLYLYKIRDLREGE